MENIYIGKAILKLRPNSEFVYQDGDYSTIQWHVLDGDAPTQSEIDVAIEQVKAEEILEAEAKATRRAELLDRLGISEEEARILLG